MADERNAVGGPRVKRARGQNLLDDWFEEQRAAARARAQHEIQQALMVNEPADIPLPGEQPAIAFHDAANLLVDAPIVWHLNHEELQQHLFYPVPQPQPADRQQQLMQQMMHQDVQAHLANLQQVAVEADQRREQEARNFMAALGGMYAAVRRPPAEAARPPPQPAPEPDAVDQFLAAAAAVPPVVEAFDVNLDAELDDDAEAAEMMERWVRPIDAAPNLPRENARMRQRIHRNVRDVQQLMMRLGGGEHDENEAEARWREHVNAQHRAAHVELLGIGLFDDDDGQDGGAAGAAGAAAAAVLTEADEAAFEAEREANETDPTIMAKKYARTCPVCYTPNPSVRATIVSCGHLVCRPCAVKVAGMAAPARAFACPVCRKEGSTWIRAWETDDAASEAPTTSSASQPAAAAQQ